MTSLYHYTPYIWPMLASAAFMAGLGLYGWRRRTVPGALSFAALMFTVWPWAVGAALELAALEVPAKIFWLKFVSVWQLPAATAALCFALEYANLGRWLTRRTLALLALPSLLVLGLILTNDAHHLLWLGFSVEDYVRPVRSSESWMLTGYGYALALASLLVLIWLFIRSPLHRWPVALCLCGQVVNRAAYLLDVANVNPFAPMDLTILATTFSSTLYAIALFRFHLFDLIPVARETVIEQMREGMVVLDTRQRIVDLNPAAEKILGVPAARVRGQPAQVLPALSDPRARLDEPEAAQFEISLGTGSATRYYALHLSPLRDQRGSPLGYLILFHDVTEQKRAQTQFLEQQRAMATLEERERLARELHDGVGQVLGYVSMQAQAIGKWVHDGQVAVAEAQLARLADAAQEAHADIRESIFSLKGGPAQEWSFLTALKQYLDSFGDNYGIRAELTIPPGRGEQAFEPGVQVQLLRVIQEALTNARKHGCARCVQVTFEFQEVQARIIVADDGCGFDPELLAKGGSDHFGLAFMRERMAQIGGGLTIHSQPGAGTQVVLQVPIRDER